LGFDVTAFDKMDTLNVLKAEVDGHLRKTFPPKQTFCAAFSALNKYSTIRQLHHFPHWSCLVAVLGKSVITTTAYYIQNR